MFFVLLYSYADAATSADILRQKDAIVTISVTDKNGNMISSGSGFVIAQSGVIVTNCSIIAKWYQKLENMLSVRTEGGMNLTLDGLITSRCENNLALLKVKNSNLPVVKLAEDYRLRQGEQIFFTDTKSIPEATVSRGVVKNLGGKKIFQVSLPVTPDRSGAPLFNSQAEVAGVLVYIPSRKQAHNFAVTLTDIVKQLDKYTRPKKLTESNAREYRAIKREERTDTAGEYFLRGAEYEKSNMLKDAIQSYEQSLSLRPDFFDAYVSLGIAYFKLGKYADAVKAYKEALRIKPDSLSIYNKLGTAYITKGEYSSACSAFRKALEIDPKNTFAHFNLGIAYYLAGNKSEAYKEYVILKDLDKKYADRLSDLIF